MKCKRNLLVISNNVLSTTNNNGKTMYSFISNMSGVSVSQLFFSGEVPRIKGYSYYRLSDRDIIRGRFNKNKRGGVVAPSIENEIKDDYSIRNVVGRNTFTLIVRELLWYRKWKSAKLIEWLDNVRPDAILFVAGDAIFAYDICTFIQKKYGARLTVYVTDDYVMPRSRESFFEMKRRKMIQGRLETILQYATCFYTISQPMHDAYKGLFHKDSHLAVNMVSDLRDETIKSTSDESVLVYTGSLYYGRNQVLGKLALSIQEYNKHHIKKARMFIYCNSEPNAATKKAICISGASEYGGSLDNEQLKEVLNKADILVFVESFDFCQVEKVKYSLSTKVPEYMSVGKPILALGPQEVGSLEYLSDVALCINDLQLINEGLTNLLDAKELQHEYGSRSRKKYLRNHDAKKLQEIFVKNILGLEETERNGMG